MHIPEGEGWQTIDTAPRDREVEVAQYYTPSDYAALHGAKPQWFYGIGRFLFDSSRGPGGHWSGVLGGYPTHWREPREVRHAA